MFYTLFHILFYGQRQEQIQRCLGVLPIGDMLLYCLLTCTNVIYDGHRQNQVEVVESFTYLGSLIHCSGSSEPEIKRRVNIVRGAGSEYTAILYHTRNQAAPLQHLCSPDILIRSGDMVDDLDIIEED